MSSPKPQPEPEPDPFGVFLRDQHKAVACEARRLAQKGAEEVVRLRTDGQVAERVEVWRRITRDARFAPSALTSVLPSARW